MNTIYSLLLNYSYTTLLSHTHMYIPTYITIYSDIDVSIMCTPHTLCIHMYVYILYHSLDLYFPLYIYILYPPIILHTLLHSISIYIIYNICIFIIYIHILSITIYITCIQYVNINSNIYCILYIIHTYICT